MENTISCYGYISAPYAVGFANWTTSDETIAWPAYQGLVTGVSAGTARIGASWTADSWFMGLNQQCEYTPLNVIAEALANILRPFITFGNVRFTDPDPPTISTDGPTTSTLSVVVSASGGFPANNGTGTLRAGIVEASGAVDIEISPATQPVQLMAGQSKKYEFRYTAKSQPTSPVTLKARVILENVPTGIDGPTPATSGNMLTVR